jgi:type I restriction enzyme R subunit
VTTGDNDFAVLLADWPELAQAGGLAETHAQGDPVAAAVHIRRFVEQLVKGLYRRWSLPSPGFQPNLFDLMKADLFEARLPQVVLAKLHRLRRLGNGAAHGDQVTTQEVTAALKDAQDVARLLPILVGAPDAQAPTPPPAAEAVASAADALGFNEAQTRIELIDGLLKEAGWGGNAVGREVPAGVERADYVLWDAHGRPLGVIEAKKTGRDPQSGAEQAKGYADALEQQHGQRPVMFLTNGFELWIWNDVAREPMRRIYGLYSRASLETLVARRAEARPLSEQPISTAVRGRQYQQEAVRRVAERFDAGHRRALIVQATGTGKTRVAVAIAEMVLKAAQAKRVLFLCDRRELRKQAKDAFAELLPAEPLRIVDGRIPGNPPERIFFATYPAMMGVYRAFDPGFFDLIIADESHRSLYNVYRELIDWFDARAIGLTATPLAAVMRNTFEMFGCENGRPTFSYPLEEAIEAKWLVPYEVWEHSTRFSREGLREDVLSEEQVRQLEEQGIDPGSLDYDSEQLDRAVFNKDTNRLVLRNLMENGIRDADGAMVGKTIVFARSHAHALLLQKLFDEMYPQYASEVARVIDSQIERAEDLIDRFKNPADPLRVAISVDMLDTGLDVPEVVNLVFARPVRSYVKFWQMIGRGTRLCADLFGPGKDKTHFRIFDHWGNFERFGETMPAPKGEEAAPLLSRLFEARVQLALAATERSDPEARSIAIKLIAADVAELDERTVAVRAKLKEKRTAQAPELLARLDKNDVALLIEDVAPLMGWRPLADPAAARFDLQVAVTQAARQRGSAGAADLEAAIREQLATLPMELAQVRDQAALIRDMQTVTWWDSATPQALEESRTRLRGLMKLAEKPAKGAPRTYDVTEETDAIRLSRRSSGLAAIDMRQYEAEVNAALRGLFDSDPALQRLRAGEPIAPADLDRLAKLVLVQNPNVDMAVLREFYPDAEALAAFFRQAVGVDPDALRARFAEFAAGHPALSGTQRRFLQMLETHIARHGAISVAQLYEPPFTGIDSAGIEGVFPDATADEVVALVQPFAPAASARPTSKDLQ